MSSNQHHGAGYYTFIKGRVYDVSMNDGSGTEAGTAVLRVSPYMRVDPAASEEERIRLEYEYGILSGSAESAERARQAAGVSSDIIKTVTNREMTSIENFANVQEVLDKMDTNLEEALETWCNSARERGLTWVWNTGSCSSKPSWRQGLLLSTRMEDSYAIFREFPLTLKSEAINPFTYNRSTQTRAGLAGIPLDRSLGTERLHLYSIMLRTRSSRSDPGADADPDADVDQAQGMLHFFAIPATHLESRAPWAEQYVANFRPEPGPSLPRITPSTVVEIHRELGFLIKSCYKWEKLVKQSAEVFASQFLVEFVPEGDETQPTRFFVPGFSCGSG